MELFTERLRGQQAFTLIELLVVVLIIGILAAIAIPAFLGQRQKSQDAGAKSMTRNAATAAESFAADNSGSYSGLDFDKLKLIEPSITETGGVTAAAAGQAITITVASGGASFTVSTQSKAGTNNFFNFTKTSGGVGYRCKAAAAATACTSSNW